MASTQIFLIEIEKFRLSCINKQKMWDKYNHGKVYGCDCYRLVTAHLLLHVSCDKIKQVSNTQIRKVSALDKYQNWIRSALFYHKYRAQSKYAAKKLIHTRTNPTRRSRVHLHSTRCSECNCSKHNARALLSSILSIFNSDWLQHGRSVSGVYESLMILVKAIIKVHNPSWVYIVSNKLVSLKRDNGDGFQCCTQFVTYPT